MSFFETTTYVVRPTEALHARVAELGDDAFLLVDTGSLSRTITEGSFKGWFEEDWIRRFKLLFLAEMHSEYLHGIDDDDAWVSRHAFHDTLEALLGEPPYRVAVFDRWWTCERLRLDRLDSREIGDSPSAALLDPEDAPLAFGLEWNGDERLHPR